MSETPTVEGFTPVNAEYAETNLKTLEGEVLSISRNGQVLSNLLLLLARNGPAATKKLFEKATQ